LRLVEQVWFEALHGRNARCLLQWRGKGRQGRATHLQLAEELGAAREAVSRILKGFECNGWARLHRGEIEIRDAEGLAT